MNSSKAEKSLAKCQFLSHFTRFPSNKFTSHSKQINLGNQPLNLKSFFVVDLHKQLVQMALQKVYLYFICNLTKTQLYLSEKTYVTNQGFIFTFYELSEKYRKRLIKRDTNNFSRNLIEIYNQFNTNIQHLGNLKSSRVDELKKFMIRNIENVQTQWTATKTIQQLQRLNIFKENIMLLNYVENSVLRAVRDKNSYLNKFFIELNLLKQQSQEIEIKALYQKNTFFKMIATVKNFLQEASKTIKLKLKPTQDQFKNYALYEQIQKLNKLNKQISVNKKLKQQFLFDYSYQYRELESKEYNKLQKQTRFLVVQDQALIHAEFFKLSQQSSIGLQLSINFDWKINGIDFPQFEMVFNQIIHSLSEVQSRNETDKLIQRSIKGFKIQHHSSSNSLFVQNVFQLNIANSVFYQFTHSIDQMLLLAKILRPIAQIYSQKSIKEILNVENKYLGPQKLYILKQQAKRCYTVYNQLFQMFIESKKN